MITTIILIMFIFALLLQWLTAVEKGLIKLIILFSFELFAFIYLATQIPH